METTRKPKVRHGEMGRRLNNRLSRRCLDRLVSRSGDAETTEDHGNTRKSTRCAISRGCQGESLGHQCCRQWRHVRAALQSIIQVARLDEISQSDGSPRRMRGASHDSARAKRRRSSDVRPRRENRRGCEWRAEARRAVTTNQAGEWVFHSPANAEEWRGHPAPPKLSDGL